MKCSDKLINNKFLPIKWYRDIDFIRKVIKNKNNIQIEIEMLSKANPQPLFTIFLILIKYSFVSINASFSISNNSLKPISLYS